MAGTVIHHISGCEFIKYLEKKGTKLTKEDKLNFLYGNLIADTLKTTFPDIGKQNRINEEVLEKEYDRLFKEGKVVKCSDLKSKYKEVNRCYNKIKQDEKMATHFRTTDEKVFEYPTVSSFISKYRELLDNNEYAALGYLYHLYTDYVFFHDLSNAFLVSLDENGKKVEKSNDCKKFYLPKSDVIVDANDVFTYGNENSIYHDYTKMNAILLKEFGCDYDLKDILEYKKEVVNPGIEEVDFNNIDRLIYSALDYIRESQTLEDIEPAIFAYDAVVNFVSHTASTFLDVVNKYRAIDKDNLVVFASNNNGKIKEVKDIFGDNVCSLKDVGASCDVVENGKTFYDNAYLKADAICDELINRGQLNFLVIADDSGLCIHSLNDYPGVLTHRHLGEDISDEVRNASFVELVSNEEDKSASFDCCLVGILVKNGEKEIVTSTGKIEGKIVSPRGNNGFGFDPILEVDGKTLAEMTLEEKNRMSARKIALEDLKNNLQSKKLTKRL